MRRKSQQAGFTLIELIVVVAIIVALMALILPAVMKARETASQMTCANNLHNIGLAFEGYLNDFNTYPTGGGDLFYPADLTADNDQPFSLIRPMPRIKSHFTPGVGRDGSIMETGIPNRRQYQDWGWAYQILPYLEQRDLWGLPNTMDDAIAARPLQIYTCPSRGWPRVVRHDFTSVYAAFGARGCTDYAGNGGPFSFAEGRGGALGQYQNPPPRDPCPPFPGTRPWSDKMDRPFIGETHSHGSFRLGMFVKNRFWPHYPNKPWSKPVYVDLPLVRGQVLDGSSYTILIGEKRINRRQLGTPQPGDEHGWTSGFGTDTIRTGSWWTKYPNPCQPCPPIGYQLCFLNGPVGDNSHFRVTCEKWCVPVYHEGFGSAHVGGMNALFVDGSVRGIRHDTATDVQRLRVWHPSLDRTKAERPHVELGVFQRLLHRRDMGTLTSTTFED